MKVPSERILREKGSFAADGIEDIDGYPPSDERVQCQLPKWGEPFQPEFKTVAVIELQAPLSIRLVHEGWRLSSATSHLHHKRGSIAPLQVM